MYVNISKMTSSKLYQLIWQRFVASQMLPAIFDQTTIDISAWDYTSAPMVRSRNSTLPARLIRLPRPSRTAKTTRKPTRVKATPCSRHRKGRFCVSTRFGGSALTEPPPRYNDATLVKDLEEKGIGRPSTYASIISTLLDREYVKKDQGRFTPTMLGERVSVLLIRSFEDIFDVTSRRGLKTSWTKLRKASLLAHSCR